MANRPTALAWYSAAWVAVPLSYAVVAQLTYSAALVGGPWPSGVYWLSIISSLAGFGTWAIYRKTRLAPPWNLAGAAIYLPVMISVLVGISFAVSCGNGDCF